jgi:hypothetical protein
MVVTARHCLAPGIPPFVFFGDDARNGTGYTVPVVDALVGNYSDLAILALQSAPPITPAPMRRSPPVPGQLVLLEGFGETDSNRGDGGVKRQSWTTVSALSDTEMEIGAIGGSNCHGDSGGPQVTMEKGVAVLTAVVSRGTWPEVEVPCSLNRTIAVRIDAFHDQFAAAENALL